MTIQFKPSALRQTRWYEYLVRFGLGGAMTVVAGLIAARFGPVIGGLFLAFPAIFPASATLIEKHVRERKEKAGLAGARRGKEAEANRDQRHGSAKAAGCSWKRQRVEPAIDRHNVESAVDRKEHRKAVAARA